MKTGKEYSYYPTAEELDAWIEDIWHLATTTPLEVEILDDAGIGDSPYLFTGQRLWKNRMVRFSPQGMETFYGYWQPVDNGPAPLCAHVPGYGSEISNHPDTVAMGFNVLDIAPLGFCTPHGIDTAKRDNPGVLPNTVLSGARSGYFLWLANCVMAVIWAWKQPEVIPDRVAFYGTSQGGGCSLLLGSLFRNRGVRCVAADEPFLCDFPLAQWQYAYAMAKEAFTIVSREKGEMEAWKALGFVDTVNHAHRLDIPVLLTAGGTDDVCPRAQVESLFAELPSTKSYTLIEGRSHGFTPEFVHLAWAWFRLFA